MSKNIKGLLIDPYAQKITEVQIPVEDDGSCLNGMYRAIGCECVDVGRGGLRYLPSHPEDDVWFDDEASFTDKTQCFAIPGWQPLIGKGLILGYDDNGNSIDHTLTPEDVEELEESIFWIERRSVE